MVEIGFGWLETIALTAVGDGSLLPDPHCMLEEEV